MTLQQIAAQARKYKNDFHKSFFICPQRWLREADRIIWISLHAQFCEGTGEAAAKKRKENMSWNLIPTQKSPVSELKNIVKVKWLHKFISIRIITDTAFSLVGWKIEEIRWEEC